MTFELTNDQRRILGLDPVDAAWSRVDLPGDRFRPASHLYFDGDTIRRHILSTEEAYEETVYEVATEGRNLILPKTSRGRPTALTAATFEKQTPRGVYLCVNSKGRFIIGSHSTQTTFYSTNWEEEERPSPVAEAIKRFIEQSPPEHLKDLDEFRRAKRRHVAFASGDYFRMKLDRTRWGFGRVLLDISKVKKSGLIGETHGFRLIMTKPVLVQMFAFATESRTTDLATLDRAPRLPSGLMMDNHLYYGEYEIVGHRNLDESEFEFPLSYGKVISWSRPNQVFFQWGFIHKEKPLGEFDKHLSVPGHSGPPYRFDGVGFAPTYGANEVSAAARNPLGFDFGHNSTYKKQYDLRNPANAPVRRELMEAFGLDPDASYMENCRRTGTPTTTEFLRRINEGS